MTAKGVLFVVVPVGSSHEAPIGLREALSDRMEIAVGATASDLKRVADRVEIVMTWNGGNPRPLLQKAGLPPLLHWIHHSGIGVDQLLYDDLIDSDITVTNMRGCDFYAQPMAEYVLAWLLTFAKRLVEVNENQRQRTWRRVCGVQVSSKTVGIVGLGTIGSAIAQLSLAFGMKVVSTRRHVTRGGPKGVTVYSPNQINDLLRESDYVLLCVPRTSETQALIGKEQLRMMKNTALLVNVGRGGLVDSAALASSLSSGEIQAAVLDVFDDEPLPPESPLWTVPNLFISPHMSAYVEGSGTAEVAGFAENFERLQTEMPLLRIVDKIRGY